MANVVIRILSLLSILLVEVYPIDCRLDYPNVGDAMYRKLYMWGPLNHWHSAIYGGINIVPRTNSGPNEFSIVPWFGHYGSVTPSGPNGVNQVYSSLHLKDMSTNGSLDFNSHEIFHDKTGESPNDHLIPMFTDFTAGRNGNYYGAHSPGNLKIETRRSILNNFWSILRHDPGYTVFGQIDPALSDNCFPCESDCWFYETCWGGCALDIDDIRCDGVVEFSYEEAEVKVWYPDGASSYWNIARCGTNNSNAHANFHYGTPDGDEICPRIQAGTGDHAGHDECTRQGDVLTHTTMRNSILQSPEMIWLTKPILCPGKSGDDPYPTSIWWSFYIKAYNTDVVWYCAAVKTKNESKYKIILKEESYETKTLFIKKILGNHYDPDPLVEKGLVSMKWEGKRVDAATNEEDCLDVNKFKVEDFDFIFYIIDESGKSVRMSYEPVSIRRR